MADFYTTDFYAWTQEQADFLRLGKIDHLDLANLTEEIESLGRQQKQELKNRLGVLLGHLLKWQYQPSQRSKSWRYTIKEQRLQILDLLDQNLRVAQANNHPLEWERLVLFSRFDDGCCPSRVDR